MGDAPISADWPDDDDIDWVRLYALAPNLWHNYLTELEERPSPAALARFADRCIRSVRCLTDLHARLPEIGLSLAAFAELHDRAWKAQFEARIAGDDHDRPIAEGETEQERRSATRAAGWPNSHDVRDLVAEEMREVVVNLHLRGLDDDRIACAMDIPKEWPGLIVARADLKAGARAAVRAHLDGGSLAEIEKKTKVPASTALRILRRIGETPHGAKKRVDAHARARDIVKLRARGLAYKEIATRLDCSIDDVKNALRRDRRHRYGGGRSAE